MDARETIFVEHSGIEVASPTALAGSEARIHGQARAPGGIEDTVALWKLRESVAQRLLEVLETTPPGILELNGFSLVSPWCHRGY